MAARLQTMELTLRGRIVLLLVSMALSAAWLSGDANARLAAALVAAPLFVDFVLKQRSLRQLRLSVRPRRTVAGAAFLEEILLRHDGRRPLRELLVREPRTGVDGSAGTLVELLAPGEQLQIHVNGRSNVRSHLLERVFEVQSHWPLGMLRVRAVLPVAAELVTEPARVELEAELLRAAQEREPAPRDTLMLAGSEFHSLREYRYGEDARTVHALRSAALGTLVRTVTRGRMPRQVGLVLDLRRPPGRPLMLGQRRFEWSLGAAASMLEFLAAQNVAAHVLVIGSRSAHTLVEGAARLHEFLTFLSEVAPSPHRPLEAAMHDALLGCEHCYWLAAGSYLDRAAMARLHREPVLLSAGGDAE